jgi:hypothetical protein
MGRFMNSKRWQVFTNVPRLKEHADGNVKAVKLVYKVAETKETSSGSSSVIKGPELGSNW